MAKVRVGRKEVHSPSSFIPGSGHYPGPTWCLGLVLPILERRSRFFLSILEQVSIVEQLFKYLNILSLEVLDEGTLHHRRFRLPTLRFRAG